MLSDPYERTWNIFSRTGDGDIRCAVPSDYPVPRFILSGSWAFWTQRLRGDPPLLGFDGRAACGLARLNGFYLFTSFATDETAQRLLLLVAPRRDAAFGLAGSSTMHRRV